MVAAQNESLAPANINASQGIWEHFTKTLHKVNTAHYEAICNRCAAKGLKGDKSAHHCLWNRVNMESISLLAAVTLIQDSWTNVKREQLLGFTVAIANRNVYASAACLVHQSHCAECPASREACTGGEQDNGADSSDHHAEQRAMKLLVLEQKAKLVALVGNSAASKRKDEVVLDIIEKPSFWKMLNQLAGDLYMEYFGGNIEDKNAVIRQFGEYKTHKDDFSLVNAYACEEDPTGFWEMMQDAKPQLAAVALRLFGMSVHAGSVERLWSALGLIQTKSCNRLDSAKAVKIAQIQAVMRSRVAIQEVTAQAKPRDNQWANLLEIWFNKIHEEEYDAEDRLEYGIGQAPHRTIIKQCLL
ncbi:hypothetical protein AXG93_2520s1050 [Marchantia polymorpha subsp. ruderalis]|uniref:HAT C-terminal dimerisation domain-containing protein n=1 Tax=Marchantia polymorpha subsp. ruderalis TaxID=1480154 RepID=A0A176W3J6_MARPO|nr:hypothetical protein AXG93_2520s1050 [Marchantia polymorpha subsp. ruderalis]